MDIFVASVSGNIVSTQSKPPEPTRYSGRPNAFLLEMFAMHADYDERYVGRKLCSTHLRKIQYNTIHTKYLHYLCILFYYISCLLYIASEPELF